MVVVARAAGLALVVAEDDGQTGDDRVRGLEEQPEDLELPVDRASDVDGDRSEGHVVGLGLVAELEDGAAQAEAAVGGDGRQPRRHGKGQVLEHELDGERRPRLGAVGGGPGDSLNDAAQRIAVVSEIERAHGDQSGAVDAEPGGDAVARPFQGELVLRVRARQRRVWQQAEVVHAVARQPAEPARPDRDRHGRLDGDLTFGGEPGPYVDAQSRAALLAEHDLERVVVAGLERAGLGHIDECGAHQLFLLAAQRAEQSVGELDLDR